VFSILEDILVFLSSSYGSAGKETLSIVSFPPFSMSKFFSSAFLLFGMVYLLFVSRGVFFFR